MQTEKIKMLIQDLVFMQDNLPDYELRKKFTDFLEKNRFKNGVEVIMKKAIMYDLYKNQSTLDAINRDINSLTNVLIKMNFGD